MIESTCGPGCLPEGLSNGVVSQIDDLHQVVTRAGEQLGPVVVQVKRRDLALQLQLTHYTLRPDTHTQLLMH